MYVKFNYSTITDIFYHLKGKQLLTVTNTGLEELYSGNNN